MNSSEKENSTGHQTNTTQCCSGFCIDLLQKFADDIGFTYELTRVDDPKWGTHTVMVALMELASWLKCPHLSTLSLIQNGRWNGLMGDLVNRRVDMVMTSLAVNSEREHVVDFTIPFMETGVAIVVAKRTGIISPTAFLGIIHRLLSL